MTGVIAEFIRDQVLLPRLKRRDVLVVYDPARRYRALCQGLGSDEVFVVEVSSGYRLDIGRRDCVENFTTPPAAIQQFRIALGRCHKPHPT